MAQECPRSILGPSTLLPARSSIDLRLGDALRHTQVTGSSLLQLRRYFDPTSAHLSWINSTNITVIVLSGIYIVLVVTEIILFTATRLHPLAYLILQVGKTTTWLVFFTLAAIGTARNYNWITDALQIGLITETVVVL